MLAILSRWMLTAALVSLLAMGCEDDPAAVGDDDGPVSDPDTSTPDLLIEHLVRAYNERNHETYEALLHEEFLFYLSDEDVAAGAEARFDRTRDLQATSNMFSGEPGQTPDGEVQPPIRSLDLRLFAGAGWTDQVGEDFVGALMRRYEVDMTIEYSDRSASAVTGLQEFYVVAVTDGENVRYELKFWRDLGHEGFKRGSSVTWGRIKAVFR